MIGPDESPLGLGTALPPQTDSQRKTTYWALGVAGVAVAAGALWWITRESYYSYVPPRYQYRPGTITAWISRVLDRHAKRRRSRRPIRVYMDGCFDLMHYGHANALRQARALGDQLVVGLVPDSEIRRCKGPPLMNEAERLEMVESVKWVDEVLTGVPYDLTPAFLEELIHKHRIDYVIHGDDPCILPDGTDAYEYAKKAGRFRLIKRTEGVSTTDIVGRLLTCSRDGARAAAERAAPALAKEFSMGRQERAATLESMSEASSSSALQSEGEDDDGDADVGRGGNDPAPVQAGQQSAARSAPMDIPGNGAMNTTAVHDEDEVGASPSGATPTQSRVLSGGTGGASAGPVRVSRFMPTSRRIVQFSSGATAPPGARIVYIDGAFDLFHVGHVEILKAARREGDFLLVGIHSDEEVRERRGRHLPIMGLHERALSVLSCRFADEVVIGAPAVITEDLLTTFGIDVVVRGSVHEVSTRQAAREAERYGVPRDKGMLRVLRSPSNMTSAALIKRVVENLAQIEERQAKKNASEAKYYSGTKQYVQEM